VAEAAVEPRMVRQRAVRPAVAVQSDVAAGSSAPRYRVDLVAAAEPAKAAHPVRAAALGAAAAGAVVPDALVVAVPAASVVVADAPVVAPVLAVAGAVVPDALAVAVVPAVPVVVEPDALVVAPVLAVAGAVVPDALVVAAVPGVLAVVEPDALVVAPAPAVREAAAPDAAGAVVPDALVVAAVPAVLTVVEPDALVVAPVLAVAGLVAAAAFSPSPFPDLLEALGRSQARYRMVWRALIQAPRSTKSCRPTAALLFWTSLPISRCKKGNFRFKVVADESVPTGALDLEYRLGMSMSNNLQLQNRTSLQWFERPALVSSINGSQEWAQAAS